MSQRKLLSQRHPILYFIAVNLRRLKASLTWLLDDKRYAKHYSNAVLPFSIKKHKSLLIRKLGDSDEQLQINKITNLSIALKRIDGILIRPGETFSFCKLVGLPTKTKGYLYGMELSFGKARPGIGGGICQLANLIHWMVWHSPLAVVQRAQHSFDPFPDEGRILPFGSGAAIFYNYIDYQFTNTTQQTFQLRINITDKNLEGVLLSDADIPTRYHIYEKAHEFVKIEEQFYRRNEIWRNTIDVKTGNIIEEEMLAKNNARVTYTPQGFE